MKAKKKPVGVKHKIREEKKREQRVALAVTVAILIAIIFISGFLINSLLNQPSTVSSAEPKAAIVDHLSLTYPNQTFIQTATNTLRQAGYTVDYYPGEEVTVGFYRNLPSHGYGLIILRVHSSASGLEGKERVEGPVVLFTSEPYSRKKYVYEQLTDQIFRVSYSVPEPPYYFAITPAFVVTSMRGNFKNTVVVMMGCEGLNNTKMAEAFIQKGVKAYISWKGPVLASYTDLATAHLLQHFLIEKQALKEAVRKTMQDVGPDPAYNSQLLYYPLEAGSYTIQNIVGNLVTDRVEIQHKSYWKTKYQRIS